MWGRYEPLPSPQEILMPGGSPVGTAGSKPGIRELPGGIEGAKQMFDDLKVGAVPSTPLDYPGQGCIPPGGKFIGLRPVSDSGDPAIDINIPEIPIKKLHFP
jgi:hypothetical protein